MSIEGRVVRFAGDPDSVDVPDAVELEKLYVEHVPRATRLAYLLTGDGELARDLVQDAFVRLAGRTFRLRRPEAFGAYLRRTVVNLATSHARRRRREQLRYSELAHQRLATDEPDLDVRAQLRVGLRSLAPRQRAALVLRYYEDLPEREVARTLGCSVPAARSLVARGREGLRRWMEGER